MANPQCPRCQSYKTQSMTVLMVATGLVLSGCGTIIFLILFFPLAPIAFLAGIVMALTSPAQKGKFSCQDCRNTFKI